MSLRQMAIDSDWALQCMLTGNNKEAYRIIQDVKDELTTMAIENEKPNHCCNND